MRRKETIPRALLGALVALALCVGCAAGDEASEEPAEPRDEAALSDEDVLRGLIEEYDQAENSKDAEGLAAQWATGGRRFEPGLAPWVGREAVLQGFKSSHEQIPQSTVANQLQDVEVLGDTAFLHGTFTFTGTLAEGSTTEDRGKWLTIAQRQADGSWLTVENMWNSDLPAPEGD